MRQRKYNMNEVNLYRENKDYWRGLFKTVKFAKEFDEYITTNKSIHDLSEGLNITTVRLSQIFDKYFRNMIALNDNNDSLVNKLPTRVVNTLRRYGIKTIADLKKLQDGEEITCDRNGQLIVFKSLEDLKKCVNIGSKYIRRIKKLV